MVPMKRLLVLTLTTFVICCHLCAADKPGPVRLAGPADGEYQDVVWFAETQPLLIRLRLTVNGRPLSAVWDEYVTKVFRHLDTNGDGYLDKNEAQRVPPPGVLFGGASGPNGSLAPAFRELDANGDGQVTRDELAAYFRRSGYGPFQISGGNQSGTYSVAFDGGLDFAALVVDLDGGYGYSTMGRNRNTDSLNEALFKLLDTNGDGKLTKAKLLAAPAVLLKRDRNEDEIITPDEITSSNSVDSMWLTALPVNEANYSFLGSRRRNSDGPFRLVAPEESPLELARVLQDRYAAKDPKERGTGLTRENLGLDTAAFARLDVDGNGRLDLEELSRFGRRTPDLELKVDLGKKASIELVKRSTPIEQHVRTGRDGALVLELGSTRVDLRGLVAPRTETAAVAKQMREQYVAEFKTADRDNNGYLDMSEAMRSTFFRNTFKLMDRDGDGKVFEKEMLAFLDDFLGLQAAAQASCASVGMTSEGKGLFELLDTDGDRRLSVREMRNAVKLLAELDRAGKGFLTRTDIPRCSQAAFRLGAAPSVVPYSEVLAVAFSPDGQLVGEQTQPSRPGRGPEWFRKMDRNGDGDVSRREFLGTDEQFRAIDTDGDGLISVEEAEAYDKKLRAIK